MTDSLSNGDRTTAMAVVCVMDRSDPAPSRGSLAGLRERLTGVAEVLCATPQGIVDAEGRVLASAPSGSATSRELVAAIAALRPGRAVALVAAGIEIPPYALERLLAVIEADAGIGQVSPLSNTDTAFSPVLAGYRFAEPPATEVMDRYVYALGSRGYYALDRCLSTCRVIGAAGVRAVADGAEHFGLSESLAEAGLESVVCDHVFVGWPGEPLEGVAVDDDPETRSAAHPLARVQRAVTEALLAEQPAPDTPALDERPVLLHIVHAWGGGVERWVRDVIAADSERAHLVLVASGQWSRRSFGQTLSLYAGSLDGPAIERWTLDTPIRSTAPAHRAYAGVLAQILRDFAVDGVVVSSLIGHSLDALATGLPTCWVLHDYYPVCPALNIYFGEVCDHCDGPRLSACFERNPFNRFFGDKDPADWLALRERLVELVAERDVRLVVPSASVRDNLARIEPRLAPEGVTVIAHGLPAWPADAPRAIEPAHDRQRLRVVVLGSLQEGKGAALIDAALPQLIDFAELYLLGCGEGGKRFLGHSGTHVMVRYDRAELPALLASIAPHCALLPSQVPETFSYTLSELQSLGIPAVATAMGSFGERIADGDNGFLIEPTGEAIVATLRRLHDEPARLTRVRERLRETPVSGMSTMLARYADLLPVGARAVCRYRLHSPGPAALREAIAWERLARRERELRTSRSRIARQRAELQSRGEWGHGLERLVEQRTQWAQQLERRTDELAGQVEHFRQRAAHLETELDERTRWAQSLEADLQERTRWGQELDRQLAERTEWAMTLSRELTATQAELVSQRQTLEQTQASVERLRAERDEMLASTSWRITAPLRRTVIAARNFRQRLRLRAARLSMAVRRGIGSLNTRGVGGTLARGRDLLREHQPPPPAPSYPAPEIDAEFEPLRLKTSAQPVASVIIPVYNNCRYTYACLRSLAEQPADLAYEVIVVDDCSSDETPSMLERIEGLRVLRNETNQGFIGACNAGAGVAHGKYLVFLNNDTAVTAGWLGALHATFDTFDEVGLVGAKLVYPDGRLQEAGGIVFNDGSGWNYGRLQDPEDPRYCYAREADYCSGACIMLTADLFHGFGGFDPLYSPAYYEDTDLAFKVRAAGKRVMVQPQARIVHFEGVTSGTDVNEGTKRYQQINQQKFLERWRHQLAHQPPAPPEEDIERAKEHRTRARALIIDACTPAPDQDSGSVRMTNIMRILRELGYKASFFADNRAYSEPYTANLQREGVEMWYHPYLSSPADFLRERGGELDVVLVSRHYIAASYIDLVREHCPHARLLFDTVDLHYLREERLAALEGKAALARQAARTKREELDVARRCDVTLVVSPYEEQELAHELPDVPVAVLSNIHRVRGCRAGFEARRDLVFIGGYQHPPNIDAVQYFCHEIFPLIRAALPEIQFHIIGSKSTWEVRKLGELDGVVFHGFVPDIEPFLDGCRLAVAPLRYGAGVKGKLNLSMSYGQPVVATATAVEGMYCRDGVDALLADDPAAFADAVVRVHDDPELWQRLSDGGLDNVERYFSFAAARRALESILSDETPTARRSA